MQTFTGFQYLLIDASNHYGLDKLTFEERLAWANTHLPTLESFASTAEAKPLFVKACMAIRRAQAGQPIGHLVAFDAVCSGIQIMSAITGCVNGARATGMVDPDRRADAYNDMTETTNQILEAEGMAGVSFPREDVKYATMTCVYGSQAVPKRLFGEGTPELDAFYEAGQTVAPGAFSLMGELRDSWQPYALSHEWRLPDGFLCRVKVMETVEHRIEVDELDHATFVYEYKENEGSKKGVANVANVIHSFDAYILRSLIRRCNYDRAEVEHAHRLITAELLERACAKPVTMIEESDPMLDYYIEQYERSKMIDTTILSYITADNVEQFGSTHLKQLNALCEQMLTHRPFPVITIHDSFACHPNNMNIVRYWYKEIMAEMADSEILSDVLSQLHGHEGTYPKLAPDLSTHIRQSNYALS